VAVDIEKIKSMEAPKGIGFQIRKLGLGVNFLAAAIDQPFPGQVTHLP